jgi:hypothetical protein
MLSESLPYLRHVAGKQRPPFLKAPEYSSLYLAPRRLRCRLTELSSCAASSRRFVSVVLRRQRQLRFSLRQGSLAAVPDGQRLATAAALDSAVTPPIA